MIPLHILSVGCGAALGGMARYMLSYMVGTNGILIANLLGCFAIGALISFFALKFSPPQALHLFLTVGFLGGFTTFSAFSIEAMSMIDTHRYTQAALYIITSVGGGLIAFLLGRFLVKLAL